MSTVSVAGICNGKTDEFLVNPGKGIATFQHFHGNPLFPGRWSEPGLLTIAGEQ